ncbi:MAG TPA: phage terminase small subunit P27 family [Terracidiphilus sp.]|jgi:P27 family predicted phage terminase small subunit
MRRKSAAEKKAAGTYRVSRDRKSPQFVTASGIKPPGYVRHNKLAHAEWTAVAPFLEAEGILKVVDISLLASYCILYARWREAALDVETYGQTLTVTSTTRTGMTQKPIANPAVRNEIMYAQAAMRAAVKFGLNPLDRPRVEASPFEKEENGNGTQSDDINDYTWSESR